ncbi:GGDEF and EAL domain-containing protein [Undibacterium sp. TS12]|uniref:sensor domain-containing protein n=1 Tax=Undibacterium sp. TS12 TaxID=2908202 RepID=UPI001F4CAC63|nr:GGDEF and EAL domain-containing protein [Undibacterium sp. TS12]MCH8622472.1 EAL domain-containing protein [Undibacterium sp. TS12]
MAADSETIRQLKLAETFFNHSVSCLVILDRDYNFIRVNQAYADACRLKIADFEGRNHFELFPSDTKLIFDEVVRTKQPFVTFTRAFEFIDQPERGITYWDWTLVPVLDANGDIEYLVFSLVEVTERKRAEEALRIASLVYQHSSDAMMVTDAENKILAINEAFTQLTGYRVEEVRGKNPNLLQSGRQSAGFYQTMWQALNTSGHWDGELWDKDKNGTAIALRLAINTVYDEAGKVAQRVALLSDITEKKRQDDLIWKQANIDSLTGLPNRHMFINQLREQIALAKESGRCLTLLLIDLDQFKEINDALGHAKGDTLLVEVARRIAACVHEPATIARLGGDEFTVVLSDNHDNAHVTAVAQAIIDKLVQVFQLGIERAYISASIGIAQYPGDGHNAGDLLRHADQAMYAAKNAGRNRYCLFTGALQEAVQSRMRLNNDLRDALKAGEFQVYYQPIVELATGAIHKAEALLRWHHPVFGMISPAEFIPLAETSGMIVEIGEWVFRQAVEQVKRLRSMHLPPFKISVNVSPVQFRHEHDFTEAWLEHLAASGLPANSIVIEITEGLLLDATEGVADKLLRFRDAGVHVALDDFGTGYSSLAYLKKFDIDYIKIDRVFVSNIDVDANDLTLCEAIIVMAHKLGLAVIAEGVETTAQRDLLVAAGCDFVQGYLISQPVPARQFEKLVI